MNENQFFEETAKALTVAGLQINAPTLDLIFRINDSIKQNDGDMSLKEIEALKSEVENEFADK